MKKVLILGAYGMLGHRLMVDLPTYGFHVTGTVRSKEPFPYPVLSEAHIIGGIDITNLSSLEELLNKESPDWVINCVGIVKQKKEAADAITSIKTNALFPHQLAEICAKDGIRVIHISTDCVFSGKKGMYTESDIPDPLDLYGRTKLLGELTEYPHCLTIRTSIIGRELGSAHSLVEWFLSNANGCVEGFVNAIYTGVTTSFLACALSKIMLDFPRLQGLYQLASQPISKYELLKMINEVYQLNIEIRKNTAFQCDRSLDGSLLQREIGLTVPAWEAMVKTMFDSDYKING